MTALSKRLMDAAELAESSPILSVMQDGLLECAGDALLLEQEHDRLRAALQMIDTGDCENYTSGHLACFKNRRTPEAIYGADRCCNSCIARRALNGVQMP